MPRHRIRSKQEDADPVMYVARPGGGQEPTPRVLLRGGSLLPYRYLSPGECFARHESMADWVGNRHGFNAVDHHSHFARHSHVAYGYVMPGTATSGGDQPGETGRFMGGAPNARASLFVPSVDPLDLRDFARDSLRNAIGQIPVLVNGGELIFDFPGLDDVWKMLKSIGTMARGLRGALGGASGTFLGWQFMVSPMGAELKALATLIQDVRDRIEFLRFSAGKEFVTYYGRTLEIPAEPIPPPVKIQFVSVEDTLDYMWSPDIAYAESVEWGRHELKSKIVVKNELEGLDEMDRVLSALVASLGLNNPVKVIWDKIPLSFLVQFVVDLDQLFFDLGNGMAGAPFKGRLRLVSSSWSILSYVGRRMFALNCLGEMDGESIVLLRQPVGEVTSRHYHREAGLPLGSYFALMTDLSDMEKVIIAALIGSRLA